MKLMSRMNTNASNSIHIFFIILNLGNKKETQNY